MKLKGRSPTKKYISPDVIILNVNPLSMFNNICPDNRSTNLSSNYTVLLYSKEYTIKKYFSLDIRLSLSHISRIVKLKLV
jgi:hypothetical protein